jgi:hypothetical protein
MIQIAPKYKQTKLFFDEPTHKYTDSCGNSYKSVTTLIHDYVPKFETDYWARYKAKELGTSAKLIKKEWDTIRDNACDMGNVYHNNFEDGIRKNSKFFNAIKYLNKSASTQMTTVADLDIIDDHVKLLNIDEFIDHTENKYPEIYEVFKYYTDRDYKIYSEIGAFLPDYLISGTIDILPIREDGFVILDWKTNRTGLRFEAGYYRKDKTVRPNQETNEWISKQDDIMLPPLGHLSNCNGNTYSLQLNIYSRMVSLITGLPCRGLALCHIEIPFVLNQYGRPQRFGDGFHIDTTKQESAKWYKIRRMDNEVNAIFHSRYQSIHGTQKKQLNLFAS